MRAFAMSETIGKVVVTGATGFIGSALCRRLLALGVEVHAVSRKPPAERVPSALRAGFAWWQGDMRELSAVREVVRAVQPDAVFHLASLVTGSRSIDYVLPTFQNNFLSTLNLLTAAAEAGAGRIVLANSFEEPDPDDPIPCSPYAAAKSCSTAYARLFHSLYQLPVVIAKIHMVYGPGQTDSAKLIPYVTRSLLRREPVKLSSGVRLVDWVYVDDVVEGLIRCATAPSAADGAEVSLGSGQMHSVRAVVEQICGLVDSPIRPEFGALPDRPHERVKRADVDASTRLIGWQPHVPLQQGLIQTVDWFRQFPNG